MKKLYLVYSSEKLSIVETWGECQSLTKGVKGTKFKSFNDNQDEDMIRWFVEFIIKEKENIKKDLEIQLKELFKLSYKDLYEYYSEFDNVVEKKDLEELQAYLDQISKDNVLAYIDGSYNEATNEYSYGVCLIKNDEILYEDAQKDTDTNGQRQINGELKAALVATKYAIEQNWETLYIAYDYAGIKEFPVSDWKTNSEETRLYKEEMQKLIKQINIVFVKIPAHNNFKHNEYVDELAKNVLGIKK